VSNRRKISLPKLAAVLASDMAGAKVTAPAPRRPVRSQPAFPRVTVERVNELLDDAPPDDRLPADYLSARVRANLTAYFDEATRAILRTQPVITCEETRPA
jgi:hypothetical protein